MKLKVFSERAGYFIDGKVNTFLDKPGIVPIKCEVTPMPTHFTFASREYSQALESCVRPYVLVALWYEENGPMTSTSTISSSTDGRPIEEARKKPMTSTTSTSTSSEEVSGE